MHSIILGGVSVRRVGGKGDVLDVGVSFFREPLEVREVKYDLAFQPPEEGLYDILVLYIDERECGDTGERLVPGQLPRNFEEDIDLFRKTIHRAYPGLRVCSRHSAKVLRDIWRSRHLKGQTSQEIESSVYKGSVRRALGRLTLLILKRCPLWPSVVT